ncbi:MAG: hypothetical protein PHT51_03495 [Patescibacteria group bacterium]|nr:hypothetical protein [Patescibacteria group bacterium]MDD4610435.1 hypothetical protein [Patescibacteria group bacterium]
MNKKNISQTVLDKIKEYHIKPRPRWEFLLKNYFIWSLGAFALILGGLAVSVIIFMFSGDDWRMFNDFEDGKLNFIVLFLPYFWLLFLALFIWLVNYDIKHTDRGYKYNIKIIISASIGASIFLGIILYAAGMGNAIDDVLSRRAPFYKHIVNQQIQFWADPENGRLIGVITSVSDKNFNLTDPEGRIWQVNNEKAQFMFPVHLSEGERIKLIGEQIEKDIFEALKIMPIGPGRGCFENMQPGGCGHKPLPPREFNLRIPLPAERNFFIERNTL